MNSYPEVRLRRYRKTAARRRLFGQPMPGPEKFIWPVFVAEGRGVYQAIESMPGQFRVSTDKLVEHLETVAENRIGGVLLFGVPDPSGKDERGSAAITEDGVVQEAVRIIRRAYPHMVVITDVCLCAYTSHGHCGVLDQAGEVDNDATLPQLAQVAASHAAAGADMVAPSAMMDGQVQAIRGLLDAKGHTDPMIMSYSTKFASAMYGPFRDAEQSAPQSGDRRGYQAPYNDLGQALRESELDEQEGADILMVKPALFYLDIIARLRDRTELPIAAYNVSGEYSMLAAAAEHGWGHLGPMVRESITALQRAGSDLIITYWANQYREIFG